MGAHHIISQTPAEYRDHKWKQVIEEPREQLQRQTSAEWKGSQIHSLEKTLSSWPASEHRETLVKCYRFQTNNKPKPKSKQTKVAVADVPARLQGAMCGTVLTRGPDILMTWKSSSRRISGILWRSERQQKSLSLGRFWASNSASFSIVFVFRLWLSWTPYSTGGQYGKYFSEGISLLINLFRGLVFDARFLWKNMNS